MNTSDPQSDRIYLDHNASTPLDEAVLAAMQPFVRERFGNPHTRHWAGKPAGEAIVAARKQVAACIGCEPGEVIFTSGASESNNHAIKGAYFASREPRDEYRGEPRDHFVTTTVEHPAVRLPLEWLRERFGCKISYVDVDSTGRVAAANVLAAVTPRTLMVCVMHANNEVGAIQPVGEIGAALRERGVLLHCDAAQSLGKIPVRVDELNCDLLSIAGHKLYAPKGVGALYIRGGVKIDPLLHGAGQEFGLRSGTENVEWIVGFGKACELAARRSSDSVREIRDYFWSRLREQFGDDIRLHGPERERLPNTLNVGFRGIIGADLLARLDGIAATTGSACHDGQVSLSHTLAAMRVDPEFGMGAVRWSLGCSTTREQIDRVIERVTVAVQEMRRAGAV